MSEPMKCAHCGKANPDDTPCTQRGCPRIVSLTGLYENPRARVQRDGTPQLAFTVKFRDGFTLTVTENSRDRAELAHASWRERYERQPK